VCPQPGVGRTVAAKSCVWSTWTGHGHQRREAPPKQRALPQPQFSGKAEALETASWVSISIGFTRGCGWVCLIGEISSELHTTWADRQAGRRHQRTAILCVPWLHPRPPAAASRGLHRCPTECATLPTSVHSQEMVRERNRMSTMRGGGGHCRATATRTQQMRASSSTRENTVGKKGKRTCTSHHHHPPPPVTVTATNTTNTHQSPPPVTANTNTYPPSHPTPNTVTCNTEHQEENMRAWHHARLPPAGCVWPTPRRAW
jgi:hypothetical protein